MNYFTSLLALALFFFSTNLLAQVQITQIPHLNCRVRILSEQVKTHTQLMELILEQLKTYKYLPYIASKHSPIIPGNLYFDFKKNMLGTGVFPPCWVAVKILKSKEKTVSKGDEVLYENSFKRKHPRSTFSGDERCRRAIRDVMERFPVCVLLKEN